MQQVCVVSESVFQIAEWDVEFYRRLHLPTPTLSPSERMLRRLFFRNENKLYKRACSLTKENIISLHSSDKPYPVYDNQIWWSDCWSATTFAREYDFTKSFFLQFRDLVYSVPKMARIQQGENENSDYCNCSSNSKNCYLIFGSSCNEDCLYSNAIRHCKDCMECYYCLRCELCYECISSDDCYHSSHLEGCKSCSNCNFLLNCIGCHECFGCVNLRQAKYCWFNEQLSKEEYIQRRSKIDLTSRHALNLASVRFKDFSFTHPRKYLHSYNSENVIGNFINNSKNCVLCFNTENLEDCKYCDSLTNAKSCMDISYYGATGSNELLYECEGVGHGANNVIFSKNIWGGSYNVAYSYECFACHDILACSGLKRAEYCILNKQYSKQEYYELANRIKAQMLINREWGEFFPIWLSPFSYQETVAADFVLLTRDQVINRSGRWSDKLATSLEHSKSLPPDSLQELAEDCLTTVYRDCKDNSPFKIQKQEYLLLKKLNLAPPEFSPNSRHTQRTLKLPGRTIHERRCSNCSCLLATVYQERLQTVLCEHCYSKLF